MKNFLFSAFVAVMILTVSFCTQAQPAAGPGGGAGGMGGGMGGRGMTVNVLRPDKNTRLASITELEKQIAALKTSIQKAPSADPNISTLTGEKLAAFTTQYDEENNAINQIVTTINTIRPAAGGRGGRGGGATGGLTADVIAELTKLAQEEKATKLAARLEALAKETTATPARGGMGGGARGGNREPPIPGGFQWID